MNKILVVVLLSLFHLTGNAASFDCNKSSTSMEKLICSNPRLSAADEQLAKNFKEALAASKDPQAVRREQKEWLTSQRDACTAAACALDAYTTRIAQLAKTSSGATTPNLSISGTTPFLVIKPIAGRAPDKNVKRQAIEVTGTIAFGHDAAGGNYIVDAGNKKQYVIAYVGFLDNATQDQLSKLDDSNAKVTVKGIIQIFKDGSTGFDNTQPIGIFK